MSIFIVVHKQTVHYLRGTYHSSTDSGPMFDTPFGTCLSIAVTVPAAIKDIATFGSLSGGLWTTEQTALVKPDGGIYRVLSVIDGSKNKLSLVQECTPDIPIVLPGCDVSTAMAAELIQRVGVEKYLKAVSKVLGMPSKVYKFPLSDVIDRAKLCTTHSLYNINHIAIAKISACKIDAEKE